MRISLPSIMIGIAATWLVIAYVVQPFRKKKAISDHTIEAWVSEIQADSTATKSIVPPVPDKSIHHCPQCGRRVEADHRFCPGCGTQLPVDALK